MRQFWLTASALGLVLAVFNLIFGHKPAHSLVGVPVFIGSLAAYARGAGTDAYDQRQVEINTERAKTSGLSRLRNR